VISYLTGQRTHEIGIRVALGASSGDVMRMVLGEGMKITIIGVAIGIAAALGLTRLIAKLIYGRRCVRPHHVCRRGCSPDGRGAARLLHSGVEGDARGPDDRSALRVTVLHLFCQPQHKTSFRGGDAILVMGVIFCEPRNQSQPFVGHRFIRISY